MWSINLASHERFAVGRLFATKTAIKFGVILEKHSEKR